MKIFGTNSPINHNDVRIKCKYCGNYIYYPIVYYGANIVCPHCLHRN